MCDEFRRRGIAIIVMLNGVRHLGVQPSDPVMRLNAGSL
jgi:hypothetical protein